MNDLESTLKRYNNIIDTMGSKAAPELLPENKEAAKQTLANDLKEIRSNNATFFWVLVIMTIIVFLLSCFLVYHFMNDPAKINALFGATGITLSGLLFFMQRSWKQKTALDMLLALASTLDADTIKTISATIVRNYLGGNN